MDWAQPHILLLLLLVLPLLWWLQQRSLHPMSPRRRRALWMVRSVLTVLLLLGLAGPAWVLKTYEQSVIFVMDHSQSQGKSGVESAFKRANQLAETLPRNTSIGFVSAGRSTKVLQVPELGHEPKEPNLEIIETDGAQSDLASAVAMARGLFPPATSRRLVLLTDGVQTRGDLESAARDASVAGITIDAVPVAGEARPDVRAIRLRSSHSRLHEGATLALHADIESSLDGKGRIRLFENGIEVEERALDVKVGDQRSLLFRRTPDQRNLYTYRVRLEGFEGDAIPQNDEAMTLVDVRGRPFLLYVEGEREEAHYLANAMESEGIRLQVRPAHSIPESLQELAGYDGIILSDLAARFLTGKRMSLMRDYVEQLGGGFLMIGGASSFGVGGYYRTPIEDILPVKMKAPDTEERVSTALVLVIDRSGSMSGQKIELCKSAAISTVELMSSKDYIGIVAFDSQARWIVPITKVKSPSSISSQISTINAGGGTNIHPGMVEGRQALNSVRAKVKHMIVLTDGHTGGSGYQALAAQIHSEKTTISTVGVGGGADIGLLQSIAAAGGGQFYQTTDPSTIPRIFTQDAMVHMKKMVREEAFKPRQVERHPMLKGWDSSKAPELLGYVKTNRKATAQVPLVTDLGDPLLAHWRYGLGKVTAFTSDCKSRWSSLWLTGWRDGYSQFWAQVLREMARPPQGRLMDIRLEERGGEARIIVDLLEDASQFKNNATVEADIYMVPANSFGSSLKELAHKKLDQEGPGLYTGQFSTDEPGVYLVRARSGADMVSAGLVHNPSSESATGRVNRQLLEKVCELTGGRILEENEVKLPPIPAGQASYVELTPYILKIMLLLFIADIVIRRWENVAGMIEWAKELAGK
ncbi:MAG: VWA domain-containing protein [Planctomycetota bacterium]|jgi:uncharacterized membrane protein|nr:VWA domain-containing protein [Planctomycetota bacterium]MDP7131928.1 VWA domain-containing protein [Planctomycetota bacterium]MDP7252660.1 VWA domain-containing protein [Planctomycetota bacterium]